MKLLAALFGKPADPEPRPQEAVAPVPPLLKPAEQPRLRAADPQGEMAMDEAPADDLLTLASGLRQDDKPATPSVNIWDLDDNDDTADVVPVASAATGGRRNRTRLIGFDHADTSLNDMFGEAPKVSASKDLCFPVGWLLVTDGPGRGHCFALVAGMSQIGRGDDQAVQLDFGDTAVSRNNHAAVVYDPESRKFMLGHGGKANIVRLNDKPVISNEDLQDGDSIRIGDTTLVLKTLCGPDFDWTDDANDAEEQDHVAIA